MKFVSNLACNKKKHKKEQERKRKLAEVFFNKKSSTVRLEFSRFCTASNNEEETPPGPSIASAVKQTKRDHIISPDCNGIRPQNYTPFTADTF